MTGEVNPRILEHHSAFIFMVKQSKNNSHVEKCVALYIRMIVWVAVDQRGW